MQTSPTPFGKYELLKRIARGGMAEIFLAVERGLEGVERQVAIKRILPQMAEAEDFVTMFMDEARVAARLNHPNIGHIYSFGEVDGVYYLAMEYVDGLNCSKLIRLAKPEHIPVKIVLRIMADTCAALHYAHDLRGSKGQRIGLVHRDVNPQNVMVSRNGVAKLLDFGVARASTQSHATQVGQVKGKIAYIAPEVFLGDRKLDHRADIFSAGAMLFEMLAGRKLFKREIEAATIHAILQDDPPLLHKVHAVPEKVDAIIAKAVAKNPDHRYQSAFDMQQDLEHLIVSLGYVASPFVMAQFIRKLLDKEANPGEGDETEFGSAESNSSSSLIAPSPLSSSCEMQRTPPSPYNLLNKEQSNQESSQDNQRKHKAVGPEFLASIGVESVSARLTPRFSAAPNIDEGDLDEFGQGKNRLGMIAAFVFGFVVMTIALCVVWFAPDEPTESAMESTASAGLRASAEPAQTSPNSTAIPTKIPLDDTASSVEAQDDESTPESTSISTDAGPRESDSANAANNKQATLPQKTDHNAGPAAQSGPEVSRAREATKRIYPPGKLYLHTSPWSKVRIGGRYLGTTPIVGASLPAGRHVLVMIDGQGRRHTRSVRIKSGQATKVFVILRNN